MKTGILIFIFFVTFTLSGFGQSKPTNILDYGKLDGLALNKDIKAILKELDNMTPVTENDQKYKSNYENRFKNKNDRTDYFVKKDTTLNPLNRIFQVYWRKSMLDNTANYDKYSQKKLVAFYKVENLKDKFTDFKIGKGTLDSVFNNYIKTKGYLSTGYGKTGSLFDFLVWKKNTDTTYHIKLINDTIDVNIHFMDGFISLGWEEYATFGKYYPGGWTTKQALFCVRQAYNIKSESFLISYLGHEGQHFSDYKHYPNLIGNDLEYRAKLSELTFANENLYKIIENFISSARYDKTNSHPFANYCVIRDMSKLLLNDDFEKDMLKWKQISKTDINNAARKLFLQNTEKLNTSGKDVKGIIE